MQKFELTTNEVRKYRQFFERIGVYENIKPASFIEGDFMQILKNLIVDLQPITVNTIIKNDIDKIHFSYRDENNEAQSGYMNKENAEKELSRLMTFKCAVKNILQYIPE